MPTSPDDIPFGVRVVKEAKAAAKATLMPDELEKMTAYQRAARERSNQRRAASAAKTRTICQMMFAGAKTRDIAAAVGMTVLGLETKCKKDGIPFANRATETRVFVWCGDDLVEALDRMALDAGVGRARMLEDLLGAILEDDALIARRVMRISRRTPSPGAHP